MPETVRHPKCGRTWSGARTCHCAGCCETFSSTSAFDLHQRGGDCADPATVRRLAAVETAHGTVWGWPRGGDAWWTA